MEQYSLGRSIPFKRSTDSCLNNALSEEHLNRLYGLISEFSSEPLSKKKVENIELISALNRITAELKSVRSDFEQPSDYHFLRAEMWKSAANENSSVEVLAKRLLSIMGAYLEFKCVCFYTIVNNGDAKKVAQWNAGDFCNDFEVLIPNELINNLIVIKEMKSVIYSMSSKNDESVTLLLKRFSTESLSILYLQSNLLQGLFLLPDFPKERIWKKWEIDCFSEMINIISLKLNQLRHSSYQESKKNDKNIGIVKERLERELNKVRNLDSIGLLAGGIANDFNSILAQVTSNLFMAKVEVKDDEVYKRITEAEKATFLATCLTKKLSSISYSSDFIKENLSVKSLIQDSVGFILKDSSIDCLLDFPDDLWSVDVDKGRMEQVVKILVDNAAQSMFDRGVIRIRAVNCVLNCSDGSVKSHNLPLVDGDYVKISFEDQGCGIPEEMEEKVFVPYFTTKLNGCGLGLTTAHAIVRQHGGHICFESVEGRGSTFFIYLPAAAVHKEQSGNCFSSLETGENNVLLIGDDPLIGIILKKLLSHSAFRVYAVTSMKKAIKLCLEKSQFEDPFSLVIIDLSISDIFSIQQAVNQFRAAASEVKVVAFCSQTNTGNTLTCKETGFDGIIGKTFSINELAEVIKNVLSEGSTIEA